jgi:lipopolysaccharide assembly protein A
MLSKTGHHQDGSLHPKRRERVLPMRFIQAVILLAFLGAVGIFAVQNTQAVTVEFLKWSVTAPVAFLTIVVYLLGMLTGWTVVSFLSRSIRRVTEPREV